MKRCFDIIIASVGVLLTLPVTLPVAFLTYWSDKHSPFYRAPRVGKHRKTFKLIKFRSMVINADRSGVDSTSANDCRITGVGKFIRRYKLDELPQLWNVLRGEMSLVGPRPNVEREVNIYTTEELHLLDVVPGITDIASIVFSDENEILKDSADPDIDYNQRIRPWKSRLGLLYIRHRSLALDLKLIALTALAIVSRERALGFVEELLRDLPTDPQLRRVASRREPLQAYPPPGATQIVTSRA